MPTLPADVRLRNKVSSVEGTVILIGAGHVDRVIRFTNLPPVLKPFMTPVPDTKDFTFPVMLNLDRGPDQEAWAAAVRDAHSRARRDKPIPQPLEVSAKHSEGWSVDVEDVPVIEYDEKAVVAEPSSLKCGSCDFEARTENGLRIHQSRAKHS